MGIEEDLQSILDGQAVAVRANIDVKPESSAEEKFIPMTKTNMCYICGAVIFDESGKILMIQEAKKSSRGEWYLPIGRLERNETILTGALREVKEEAGIDCEFITLLSVEMQSSTWMRFIFFGTIKEGTKLKTLEEQDSESLQAKMFTLDELQKSRHMIRAPDIFKLIDAAKKYWKTDAASRRPSCFPVVSPHMRLLHRVVVTDRSNSKDQPINVLVNTTDSDHIPLTLLNYRHHGHLAASVYGILKEALGSNLDASASSVRMCGILGVEHKGTGELEDGCCLTSLVSLDLQGQPPAPAQERYEWRPLHNKELVSRIESAAKGKLVPFLS
ncbi:8-oxo-dGDP phosphatase NUDT18-like [Elysia marginata]|uniref:8-oxo-dGDP phosphatase NUDT18-like n=1 Tax=Elysia marginata TaxID=1093978 RepID=A0AAV4IJJ1_9GAST|nr:8-oxo-dGDP phosphatase NUDT18-like [Elysia marginata]